MMYFHTHIIEASEWSNQDSQSNQSRANTNKAGFISAVTPSCMFYYGPAGSVLITYE